MLYAQADCYPYRAKWRRELICKAVFNPMMPLEKGDTTRLAIRARQVTVLIATRLRIAGYDKIAIAMEKCPILGRKPLRAYQRGFVKAKFRCHRSPCVQCYGRRIIKVISDAVNYSRDTYPKQNRRLTLEQVRIELPDDPTAARKLINDERRKIRQNICYRKLRAWMLTTVWINVNGPLVARITVIYPHTDKLIKSVTKAEHRIFYVTSWGSKIAAAKTFSFPLRVPNSYSIKMLDAERLHKYISTLHQLNGIAVLGPKIPSDVSPPT